MKLSSFLFLTFITNILLKKEQKTTVKETKNKYEEDKGYFPPTKIYELNDILFDYYIREGKIYRWFILFYSKTCGHCRRAKKEIQKVFEELQEDDSIRFAEMEAYDNTMTNVRFNITGVPYIILVENNSIYELNLFPNFDNIKNFILTIFSEVKDELKPLPKKVKFHYVAWVMFKQTLESIGNGINSLVSKTRLKNKVNPFVILFAVIVIIILFCVGLVKCCIYCCCNDEDLANELKILEEQYKAEMEKRKASGVAGADGQEEEGEEMEYEEYEEEEDDEGEEKEDEKELTEEEKKKREEEKKKKEEAKKKKEEERRI
jgi:thiol-disulfide isomerase/thioredoxin